MAKVLLKKQDPNKKTPIVEKPKVKLSLMTPAEGPHPDSVKMADNLLESSAYKGKTGLNPTDPRYNQRMIKLMDKHVVPTVMKHKEAADKYYNEQKVLNPEYQGSTAKELDAVTGGEGASHIYAHKVYQKNRAVFSPKKLPKLAETKQGQKVPSQPKFGGKAKGTEDLYVPDERLAESKKTPPVQLAKK
ncbi:MAG: hypothetical protein V4721_10220 [Bacteroidota bacterium]